MEKKPVRRVVTGHDEQGKAVVLIDAPTPYVNQRGEGNVVQLLWINNETPADLSHTRDQAAQKTGVPPPRNGAILRVVDFAPYDGKVPQGIIFVPYGPPTCHLMGRYTDGTGMPTSKGWEVEVEPVA